MQEHIVACIFCQFLTNVGRHDVAVRKWVAEMLVKQYVGRTHLLAYALDDRSFRCSYTALWTLPCLRRCLSLASTILRTWEAERSTLAVRRGGARQVIEPSASLVRVSLRYGWRLWCCSGSVSC